MGYGNSPLEKSRIYHHEHPKNYSFLMHDPNKEYGGHVIYYDESRYRVKSSKTSNFITEDNDNAIIFMGDSYTEGLQVSFEKTFADIIGKTLEVPTLNLGVSSYSPILYKSQVKNEVVQSQGSLIIMQVYSNDFHDDNKYLSREKYNKNFQGIDGGKKNKFLILARNSYVLRFIRKYQLLFDQYKVSEKEKKDIVNKIFSLRKTIKIEDLLYTSKIIVDIDKLLKKNGKRLFVFMIPSLDFSSGRKCCKKDKLYNDFMYQMKLNNINTLDVASYFNISKKQEDLFYKLDIHLTEFGHRVMADAILSELKNHDLVE